MVVQNSADPYVSIYEVLDTICFAGAVAAGAQGVLYRAVDELRSCAAPAEHIDLAQRLSISLHKLNWANLNGEVEEGETIRAELQTLGARWLQMPLALHQVRGHA